jgi:hypothetical protein
LIHLGEDRAETLIAEIPKMVSRDANLFCGGLWDTEVSAEGSSLLGRKFGECPPPPDGPSRREPIEKSVNKCRGDVLGRMVVTLGEVQKPWKPNVKIRFQGDGLNQLSDGLSLAELGAW